MRKIILTTFIILALISLSGCVDNKKPSIEFNDEDIKNDGGFVDATDGTVTDDLKEIFDLASSTYTEGRYEPIEFVSSQVVAGMKYRFLCKEVDGSDELFYVTILKDLEGNCVITSVEDANK